MPKSDRGFASMPEYERKQIASMGGKAVHEQGLGHQWTKEEAKEAGRKGGLKAAANRRSREFREEKGIVR